MGLFRRIFSRLRRKETTTTTVLSPTRTSSVKVTDFTSGDSVKTITSTSPSGGTITTRTVSSSGGGSVSPTQRTSLIQETQKLEAAGKSIVLIPPRRKIRPRAIITRKLPPRRKIRPREKITMRKLPARLPEIRKKITFGNPLAFGRSFNKATGSTSFTIAIPIRRQEGKILVRDFNFQFKDGKIVKVKPTGRALITEEQFLKADKRRRDKNPGFTFGDTRTKKEVRIKPKKEKLISIDKELGKERREKLKEFVKKEIGFNFFEKEQNRQETKIQNEINTFAQNRQDFYQGRVNKGEISVDEANKKLEKDIDQKFNKSVSQSEFFRSKDQRRVTSNSIAFGYETERLKALDRGEKKRANALLFLETVAEAPSSLVKLGIDVKKGVTNLINDPKARETSIQNIKKAFGKESIKGFPSQIEVKASELANFVLTSPGTALAIVGGSLVGFGLISKAGRPVLRLTGVISKKASRKIVKQLKFKPLVQSGLKDIGKVTITISPGVLKPTIRGLNVSVRVSKKTIRLFDKAIKQTKAVKEVKRIGKKLSKEQLRIRRRRIERRLKAIIANTRIIRRLKKREITKEKLEFKKRVKKRRKEKEKRRKLLLAKKKREARIKKLKATKIAKAIKKVKKVPKKIKVKIAKAPITKKIKKITRKAKEKRIKVIEKKRITKRRKEKIARRKELIKEEKFRKSKIGKLKAKASKKLKKVSEIINRLETPTAKLLLGKSKLKTPLSKTFQKEVRIGINDRAVKIFVIKQLKKRGINFNKLSGIDKNFVIGQVKAKMRTQPELFLSKTQKLSLKRFRKAQAKKIKKQKVIVKLKGGDIVITRIKPPKPTREIRPSPRRQILLQKQKLKKPKQIITELQIRPAELTKTQKISLKRFNRLQSKQRLVQKEISVLKKKPIQKLKTKQKIRSKSKQLQKLVGRTLVLSRQISKQVQLSRTAQKLRITPRQVISPAQKAKIRITPRIKPTLKVVPPRLFKKPLIILLKPKRRVKKKVKVKKRAFNVFGKPVKGKKLIKLNKKPLSRSAAKDLGSKLVDTSLSRRFKLKPTGGKPSKSGRVTSGNFSRTRQKFRDFRIVKGKRVPLKNTFIEKKGKFLLDTRGEKKGITLRRRLAMLKNLEKARKVKQSKRTKLSKFKVRKKR